jgi:hypothetical protein
MKVQTIIVAAGLMAGLAVPAFAQGNPGTTGGASGSIGGTQAGRTTAPGGSNGDAATPAPTGRSSGMNSMSGAPAREGTTSGTYGGTQVPSH